MAKVSKEQRSWILYDWANSAYSMVITSTIFPIFYKAIADKQGISGTDSTANIGFANSIATVLLFIISPILGTIADYKGFKKKFFNFFVLLGVISTALLAIIPSQSSFLLLLMYIITTLGFSGSNIFYDSFLTDVSEEKDMDRISTFGFAFGYIGSTIPFIICMALVILAETLKGRFFLTTDSAMKVSFVITAIWWGIFTIPMIKNVHQKNFIEKEPNYIKKSFERMYATFKNIMEYKTAFLFLLAYFFYIDGVDTIIKMATSYGTDLNIDSTTLLIVLLVTQFVAFPFAIIYAHLAEKFGAHKMIFTAILVYCVVCVYALFLRTKLDFWIIAMLIGTSQGGIQSLSRSFFGKLIPKEKSNQFFGFYNIFGKFAAIVGPTLLGITAKIFGDTRYGVFSIILLFIAGGSVFYYNFIKKEIHLQ